MSKRDEILKALESERFMLKCREDALAQQRVTIEALELALHEEEERIQYDDYVAQQESQEYAAGFVAGCKAADDPNHSAETF